MNIELICSENPPKETILAQKMSKLKAYMQQQESEGGYKVLKELKTLSKAELLNKLTEINAINERLSKMEGIYMKLTCLLRYIVW